MYAFFRANRGVSSAIGRLWPHTRYNPFTDYATIVAGQMSEPGTARVADVGAGLSSPYAKLRPRDGVYVIGVDISEEDMASNASLDERRVADVIAGALPFEEGEFTTTARAPRFPSSCAAPASTSSSFSGRLLRGRPPTFRSSCPPTCSCYSPRSPPRHPDGAISAPRCSSWRANAETTMS